MCCSLCSLLCPTQDAAEEPMCVHHLMYNGVASALYFLFDLCVSRQKCPCAGVCVVQTRSGVSLPLGLLTHSHARLHSSPSLCTSSTAAHWGCRGGPAACMTDADYYITGTVDVNSKSKVNGADKSHINACPLHDGRSYSRGCMFLLP